MYYGPYNKQNEIQYIFFSQSTRWTLISANIYDASWPPFYCCESIFIRWHAFSSKCIDPWALEFVVSNTTGNNQWENYISLDFNFCDLSEPQNPRKLETYD